MFVFFLPASHGSYHDVSFLIDDDSTAVDVCPTIDIDDVNGHEDRRESPLESDSTALTASVPEPLEEGSPPIAAPAVLGDEVVHDDEVDGDGAVCSDVGDEVTCSDAKHEAVCGSEEEGADVEGTGCLNVEARSFVAQPAPAPAALSFLSSSRYGGGGLFLLSTWYILPQILV